MANADGSSASSYAMGVALKPAVIVMLVLSLAIWLALGRLSHERNPAFVSPPAVSVVAPESGQTGAADGGSHAAAAGESAAGGLTFHGYACTVDCSGHRAGYAWAHDEGITDPSRCPGLPRNLRSVNEGCWAEAGREGP